MLSSISLGRAAVLALLCSAVSAQLVPVASNVTSSSSLLDPDFDDFEEDVSGDDWQDAGAGLMMMAPRDMADSATLAHPVTRDLVSTGAGHVAHVQLDERTGAVDVSINPANHLAKRAGARVTWYSGHDLLHPMCGRKHTSWNPTDKSFVAATPLKWKGAPGCGKFVKICLSSGKKCVVVRRVDGCGGCSSQTKPWFDLSQAAFKKLYSLGVGQKDGLKYKIVSSPVKGGDTKANVAKYGYKTL